MTVIMLEEKGRVPVAADRDKIIERFLKEENLTGVKLYAGEIVKSLLAIGQLFTGLSDDDFRILFIKTSEDRIFVLSSDQQREFNKRINAAMKSNIDMDASLAVLEILASI